MISELSSTTISNPFQKEVPITFHSKIFKNPVDTDMLSNNLAFRTLNWDFKCQSLIFSAEVGNGPKPSASYMNDPTVEII